MDAGELNQLFQEERAKSKRLQQELEEALISLDEEKWLTEKQKEELVKLEVTVVELTQQKDALEKALKERGPEKNEQLLGQDSGPKKEGGEATDTVLEQSQVPEDNSHRDMSHHKVEGSGPSSDKQSANGDGPVATAEGQLVHTVDQDHGADDQQGLAHASNGLAQGAGAGKTTEMPPDTAETAPSSMANEHQELKMALDESKGKLVAAEEKAASMQKQYTALTVDYNALKQTVNDLKQRIDTAEEESRAHSAIARRSSQAQLQIEGEVKQMEVERRVLMEECEQLRKEADLLQAKLRTAEGKVEAETAARMEVQKALSRLKKNNALEEAKVQELQQKLQVCEAALNEKSTELDALKHQVAELKSVVDAKITVNEELCSQIERYKVQDEIVSNLIRGWQHDSEVTACTDCNEQFSVTNRRHHCRVCGRIFCGNCTSIRHQLVISRKPSKVCIACFQLLVTYVSQPQKQPRQPGVPVE